MSVNVSYPIDPLDLNALIAAGWTSLTLWAASSPDGTYTNTSVTPTPATLALVSSGGTPYLTTFSDSTGNPSGWFKVLPYDGANYGALSDASPFHGGGGTTLATLRQHLGDELRDMRIGTLTTGSNSTTAIFSTIDVARWQDHYFDNWFANNTTRGLWAPVGAWTNSTATATTPLGITSQATGDTVELTRRFTPDEYRKALNWAIVSAYPVLSKTIVNTSLETQTTVYQFDVPQDIKSVSSLEIESGNFITSTNAATRGFPWTDIPFKIIKDGIRQKIELDSFLTPGRRLRIIGTGPMSQLYNDTDYVEEIEPQLDILVYYAAFRLYSSLPNDAASSDIDRYNQQSQHYWQLASQLKDSYMQSRPPKRMWSAESRSNFARGRFATGSFNRSDGSL